MAERSSARRIILIALAAITAAAALATLVLTLIGNRGPKSPYPDAGYEDKDFVFISSEDKDKNIFEDEDYMGLDRTLHLKIGGEEFGIPNASSEDADEAALFFLEYFDAVAKGDSERHNAMFSDEYYETFSPQEEFTQQMVYDIHITRLSYVDNEGELEMAYSVQYMIHKNNGTFRRDILSDAARPLAFYLSGTKGELKIDYIGSWPDPR